MDYSYLILLVYDGAFIIGLFLFSLLFVVLWGRQMMINVIFGLYFGLLFTLIAPFSPTDLWTILGFFTLATLIGTAVTSRLMPESFKEGKFESFGKKILLSLAATLLVTLYSFHIIPLHEVFTISSPIHNIFASETSFFWLLIAPFVLLYFHR